MPVLIYTGFLNTDRYKQWLLLRMEEAVPPAGAVTLAEAVAPAEAAISGAPRGGTQVTTEEIAAEAAAEADARTPGVVRDEVMG